jgi:hypothetical protein
MSENIQALKDFWKSFKSLTRISIDDVSRLEEKLSHAVSTIEDLEKSRDNWKRKYMELKNGKA